MPEYSPFPGITVIKFTHWRRIKYYITGLAIFILIITACEKDEKIELPVVSTVTVSNIGSTTALSGGEITQDGGGTITSRGIVWGTINNPNLVYNKGFTNDGTGIGVYISHLTSLSKNTTYYIRAYATNIAGTNYGIEVIFSTLAEQAKVTTSNPGNITSASVSCGGNVTDDGGIVIVERGVCWSTSENPTHYNSHTSDGTGAGEFNSLISWLTPGTTYHVRAFARNSMGISYGNQVSFSTPPGSGSGEIVFGGALQKWISTMAHTGQLPVPTTVLISTVTIKRMDIQSAV